MTTTATTTRKFKIVLEGLDREVTIESTSEKQACYDAWAALTDSERAALISSEAFEV